MDNDNSRIPYVACHPNVAAKFDWSAWLPMLSLSAGIAFVLCQIGFSSTVEQKLRSSAYALVTEDYRSAEQLALSALTLDPNSDAGRVLAATAVTKLGRPRDAIKLFSGIQQTASIDVRLAAAKGLAELNLELGEATAAESHLRETLSLDPDHDWANAQLAFLLQVEGRCWESLPYLRHALVRHTLTADQLVLIGAPERIFSGDDQFVRHCLTARPDDPLPLLGEAKDAMLNGNRDYARKILDRIIQVRPDSLEAQARWGRLRLEVEGPDGMSQWLAQLPANADSHPEIWVTRGYWMKQLGREQDAIGCFAAAIRLFPDHVGATYQLSQLLAAAGQSKSAARFATRSSQLSKLENVMRASVIDRLREAYDLLIALDRIPEALGWCRVMLLKKPESEWANEGVQRYRYRLSESPPDLLSDILPTILARQTPFHQPADRHEATTPTTDETVSITFRDDASSSGLTFQYVNGTTPTAGLDHMIQGFGAGCGVIDYDGDSVPDLYLCQSGIWPVNPAQNPSVDQFFRNRGDGTFANVTEHAGLGDAEFSQGLAVGDFDNDGFPDLFVGNIGPDRLYHNNGDGTFTDVTQASQIASDFAWTTSAAFADFNGDGLPDLYVVRYLVLAEVTSYSCDSKGRPTGCSPTMFNSEQDRLYLNQGDGRFIDQTVASGIVARDGKGLGILVADFQNRGQLDIFVANDTTPNFFFVNATTERGGTPIFHEEALLRGLALNEDGLAQACMGIGCDDADGNGQLDLYVTNFYADYNTLYLQQSDQTFVDLTRRAGLVEPTFHLLGFGTQFIDADLDGWPDLLVANGHVSRTFATNVADAMPTQFFRNLGKARFAELPASRLGPYFQRRAFGRPMSRLDWNADGREDVCIVHLDIPAALLTNTTSTTGHWASVRLRATDSARDAIGARIRLTAGDRTWLRQVTAGDGYMSANEQRLIFGVGQNSKIDQVEIIWPSGRREVYDDIPLECDLIAIEGTQRLVKLPR